MTIHPPTVRPAPGRCKNLVIYAEWRPVPGDVLTCLGFYCERNKRFVIISHVSELDILGWCYTPKFDPAKVGVKQ
jgi:hypothetical protein